VKTHKNSSEATQKGKVIFSSVSGLVDMSVKEEKYERIEGKSKRSSCGDCRVELLERGRFYWSSLFVGG